PDAWHTVEVIAEGDRIRILIDGMERLACLDEGSAFRRGAVALCFLPGSTTHFRDIAIKELPARPETKSSADPRERWVHRAMKGNQWNERWGVFQRAGEKTWVESVSDHPRFLRFKFTEVGRTGEYVELERGAGGNKVVVRLYERHGDLGP